MEVGAVYDSYYASAKIYIRKEEKQTGFAEKVAEKSPVSPEDMTLDAYKAYFHEKMKSLYVHPSQRGMNWVIAYTHVDDTWEKCYGYTKGMKENVGYAGSSSTKGADAGRQKKTRQKERLEEYLEKRERMKEFQQEALDENIVTETEASGDSLFG